MTDKLAFRCCPCRDFPVGAVRVWRGFQVVRLRDVEIGPPGSGWFPRFMVWPIMPWRVNYPWYGVYSSARNARGGISTHIAFWRKRPGAQPWKPDSVEAWFAGRPA